MHVGAGAGQRDVVQYLQIKGARIDAADRHGDTPLHWAARHGHVAVVRYLCDETINVNPFNKVLIYYYVIIILYLILRSVILYLICSI